MADPKPLELTRENVVGIITRLRDQVFRALENAPPEVNERMAQIFNDTLVGVPTAEMSQSAPNITTGQQAPMVTPPPEAPEQPKAKAKS